MQPPSNEEARGAAASSQDCASAFVELLFGNMRSEGCFVSPMLGSKDYSHVTGAPSTEAVEKHLLGECSIAVCLDDGGCSPALVLDIDIDKNQVIPENLRTALLYASEV